MMRVALLTVLVAGCAGPPTADGLFQNPVAIAATPDGTIWVVDAGTAEVLALRDGVVVRRIGGAGTGDDAFLDPVDVDPTNGQTIFVADRAAGAIVRVTAEGRVAQSIAVPDLDPAQPVRQSVRTEARGQPIAVAAAPDGGLYVIDGGRRHVLKLDAAGAVERVLTGFSDPIDVAVSYDGTLYVADAGKDEVRAFDAFGADLRKRPAYGAVSVSLWGRHLAMASAGGLVIESGETELSVPHAPLSASIRGVALLSPTRWVLLTVDGIEMGGVVGD